MESTVWDLWHWLAVFQRELLLFAGVFFLIGAADDIAIDCAWLWLKFTGKVKTPLVDRKALQGQELNGPVAVFIPAWQEAGVICDTIVHALKAWPQDAMRLYVGCYRNDPDTIAAAMRAARVASGWGEHRLRIVVLDHNGPTTKADCLNRLHQALRDDEWRSGQLFNTIVFHDAEDMVDPAGLGLLEAAISDGADFAQLPVEPLIPPHAGFFARHLGSHYCEEFAEAHGKAMVVRGALGAALPAAGVGCAISRRALQALAQRSRDGDPFNPTSLTEDYLLGLTIGEMGGECRFVRARGDDGRFVATRAYFPSNLRDVIRQKTRWVHGIALQGWDHVGWNGGAIESWMRARDRRGPFTALVLLIGYALLVLTAAMWSASTAGLLPEQTLTPTLRILLWANLVAFAWRTLWRFGFTAQSYGFFEGVRAVLRIPLTNVVAIIAGRRAVTAYIRTLLGRAAVWDKTPHSTHPTVANSNVRGAEQ
ncbi:MAG: glycosyl transferase family protein [Pseudomonadota bacterium]